MNSHEVAQNIRLTIVGDRSVGKTCILQNYTASIQSTEYVPTVCDDITLQIVVDNHIVKLQLWDTAGYEPYNQLRTLSYAYANIYLIVFSVIDQVSFENWYPELSQGNLINIPKLIVGNKIDLRNEENLQHIQYETAKTHFETMKCKYFECSTQTNIGLQQIFEEAIRTVIPKKQEFQSDIETHKLPKKKEKEQEPLCNCSLF